MTLVFSCLSLSRTCGYATEQRKTYCSLSQTAGWVRAGGSREAWLMTLLWVLVGGTVALGALRSPD